MGTINWTCVVLGGLVAGVIINVFEFLLNGVILANDMQARNCRPGQADGWRGARFVYGLGFSGRYFRCLALRSLALPFWRWTGYCALRGGSSLDVSVICWPPSYRSR
jgi:hypothetical protein